MEPSVNAGGDRSEGGLVCYVNVFGRKDAFYKAIGFVSPDVSAERLAGLLEKIAREDYAGAIKILRSW